MKKIWLVRIKKHILGPIDQDELAQMADEKRISSKDEVTKTLKQWIFFENFSKESEKTAESFSPKSAKKWSKSQKLLKDTATAVLSNFSKKKENEEDLSVTEAAPQKDKKIDVKKAEVIDYKVPPSETVIEKEPKTKAQFESRESVRKKQSPYRYVYFIWFIAVGLSCLAAFFYFFQKNIFFYKKLKSEISYKEDWLEAGNYKKVLEVLKKIQITTDSDRLLFSSLLLQEEGNVYESQNVLEEIVETNLNSEEQGRLLVLKGLLEYNNQNYSQAESLFDSALNSSMKDLWPASINKVILKIKLGENEEALNILNTLIEQGFKKKLILFLKSYLDNSSEEVDQILNSLAEAGGAYAQEALVLLTYRKLQKLNSTEEIKKTSDPNTAINESATNSLAENSDTKKIDKRAGSNEITTNKETISSNTENLQSPIQNFQESPENSLSLLEKEDYIVKILDQNPYLAYKHDILSYKPSRVWEDFLLDICLKIYNHSPESSEFLALYSFCLTRAGKVELSSSYIEKALDQSPKSPLFQSVYSFILSRRGLEERALSYMNGAVQNKESKFILPFILKGLFCQRLEDVKCAEEMWEKVEALGSKSASVLAGKAWIHNRLGQNIQAEEILQEGLERFPDNINLLELKMEFKERQKKN